MENEKLPLFEPMVNPSVPPDDEMRLSKQCWMMYKRLLRGPATNVELMDLCNTKAPSARRSDVRHELREHGWDLKMIKRRGQGVNLYAIIGPDGKVWNE